MPIPRQAPGDGARVSREDKNVRTIMAAAVTA